MTRGFEEVLGIDFSKSFVNACNTLKDHGRMVYFVTTEGDLVQNLEAKVSPDLVRTVFKYKYYIGLKHAYDQSVKKY